MLERRGAAGDADGRSAAGRCDARRGSQAGDAVAPRRARRRCRPEAPGSGAGGGTRKELRDFASLLLVEGLGPRTLQSLALIAEVVHGAPSRFADPARFSFAHGGKDGHPFPVPLKTYDESLSVLRRALDAARLGHTEKLRRLPPPRPADPKRGRAARASGGFHRCHRSRKAISQSIGGRTVFDDRSVSRSSLKRHQQLSLFTDAEKL